MYSGECAINPDINPEHAVCNFNSEYKVSYIMACINFVANNYNAGSDWLVLVGHG